MTATQILSTIGQAHQVGDRVRVQRKGITYPGRISSIHHRDNGVEYVVHTDATDGGMGHIVNIWTTSGHSSFLTPAPAGGEAR
jgi:hypothetical protein